MVARTRHMAIALMVAILAGASPAGAAVRPTDTPAPRLDATLTPMPLDGRMPLLVPEDEVEPIPRHSAAVPVRADDATPAAEPDGPAPNHDGDHTAPLFAIGGIGALLALFVALWVAGRRPRQDRTA